MKMLKSMLIAVVAVAGLSLTACNGGKADGAKDKAGDGKEVTKTDDSVEMEDDDQFVDIDDLQAEYTVIDFNAVWCGPCKQFAPVFEAAAERYDDIDFVSVDVDENPELAERFGVESIPMVVILNSDGEVISQNIGYMDADDFETFLSSAGVI